jgi:hypothetical protein
MLNAKQWQGKVTKRELTNILFPSASRSMT